MKTISYYFFILIFSIYALSVVANIPTDESSPESEKIIDIEELSPIVEVLDSLLVLHFCQVNFLITDTETLNIYKFGTDEIPVYPDSIYEHRLNQLCSPIAFTYNSDVKQFIELYTIKKREQVSRMIGLSHLYYPMITEMLDKCNLPHELKHLAVIESALNNNAVSKRGATGMWQFMYSTARLYALNINSYIDERKDPYKATQAAIYFLQDLYAVYHNWLLVIAAYNCGPGNVNKAIRRSGGKTDFWAIREYLPKETRGYVPAFIAANYVMNYYINHNLYPKEPEYNYSYVDSVMVTSELSLDHLSVALNISMEELQFFNPFIKSDKIPFNPDGIPLYLPFEKTGQFIDKKDSLYNLSIIGIANQNDNLKIQNAQLSMNDGDEQLKDKIKLFYNVKPGDNLSYIASRYDCNTQDIKNWNNIDGNNINTGQNLVIYVAENNSEKYLKINEDENNKRIKMISNPTGDKDFIKDDNYVYHKVKAGDTLWDIARQYNDVTVEQLKLLNKITNTKQLKPGMIIKIQKAG